MNLKGVESSEAILYLPAMYRYLYDSKHHFWNKTFRLLKNKWAKRWLMNTVIRPPHYSTFIFNDKDKAGYEEAMKSTFLPEIMQVRVSELFLTSLSVGIIAQARFIPAIRLPNELNFNHKKLKQIESYSHRTDKKGEMLFQSKTRELLDNWKISIGDKLLNFISNKTYKLKLVTDLPLEWISLDKIPLMFTHQISKIPNTPGNLMLNQCSTETGIRIKVHELTPILIIRSFICNDPIKSALEDSFIQHDLPPYDYQFVDVQSKGELTEVLKQTNCNIIIFDCHGNHGGDESHGWLKIGDENVDIWTLTDIIMPPIIILSACMTSALAGSHASVANGFIQRGSYSVLGTYLSVDAIKSAKLVRSIIKLIFKAIKEIEQQNYNCMTWQLIIHTAITLSYINDFIDCMNEHVETITEEQKSQLLQTGINYLFEKPNEWIDYFIVDAAKILNVNEQTIIELVSNEMSLIESMYYNQQGNAEKIIIDLEV